MLKKKQKRWIEVNLEKKYIVFEDKPKEKIPITSGKIHLDWKNQKLNIQVKLRKEVSSHSSTH